jgi:hypothetical protein
MACGVSGIMPEIRGALTPWASCNSATWYGTCACVLEIRPCLRYRYSPQIEPETVLEPVRLKLVPHRDWAFGLAFLYSNVYDHGHLLLHLRFRCISSCATSLQTLRWTRSRGRGHIGKMWLSFGLSDTVLPPHLAQITNCADVDLAGNGGR